MKTNINTLNFSETRNPLIDENDIHETATKLAEALHFISGAMLSDSVNDAQARRGCSLMLDMCTQASEYIGSLTHPENNT